MKNTADVIYYFAAIRNIIEQGEQHRIDLFPFR